MVVPEKCQVPILNELHETHQGIVRMKSLSRSYVWWPGLDQAIEEIVRACSSCQEVGNRPAKSPLHP